MSASRLRLVGVAAVAALASACSFSPYSLPLPGGAAHGQTITVHADFDDVQDLVPDAAVRVNNVAVGDVTAITFDKHDLKAHVTLKINKSVHLPANAVATLEQTTLLGEKYVALSAPSSPVQPVGTLTDGATISDVGTDLPDVEQVFGLLSAVLNGGDLQDLQTINVEVTKALAGRETDVKSALNQLDTFVRDLNGQRNQIVDALDQLNRFSGVLASQTQTISTALDELGPGLKVLADETPQLTDLLTSLSKFGQVATKVITASRTATVADLRNLQPILAHLAAAGTNLPHSLELLITYPFPKAVQNAIPGDYNGLKLSFNADPIFCYLLGAAQATYPAACSAYIASPPTLDTTPSTKKSGKATTTPLPTPSTTPTLIVPGTGGKPLPVPLPSLLPTPSTSSGTDGTDLLHMLTGGVL